MSVEIRTREGMNIFTNKDWVKEKKSMKRGKKSETEKTSEIGELLNFDEKLRLAKAAQFCSRYFYFLFCIFGIHSTSWKASNSCSRYWTSHQFSFLCLSFPYTDFVGCYTISFIPTLHFPFSFSHTVCLSLWSSVSSAFAFCLSHSLSLQELKFYLEEICKTLEFRISSLGNIK